MLMKYAWYLLIGVSILTVIALTAHFVKSDENMGQPTTFRSSGYEVHLQMNEAPVKPMTNHDLIISIQDDLGLPVDAAEISISLRMPDMFCGTFNFTAEQTSPGMYKSTVKPVMPGIWDVEASIRIGSKLLDVTHTFRTAP
ncbi:FixH family protein [Paenibacillus eucommiae]|uniref:YtkA-like domain-containing protein n=1 Tax=Paenibacillus eucommiae TaxID=1355755 RepID=A0ABS4IQ87_9BACL|nr:FixH family protein [Paenibacillus eucommiae]MBP1989737.1 hypothetical protein [Paenibacillus eucommiae]